MSAHHPTTDAPVMPFTEWYGLPKGDSSCSSVMAFSPSSLLLHEYEMVHPGGDKTERIPVCVFVIKHEKTGKYAIFDLGLWNDWSDTIAAEHKSQYDVFEVQVEEDMDKVIAKKGVDPNDVEVIVISHHHFDHCGTVSGFERFPNARIIIGPDSRSKIVALKDHKNVTELSWHHSPTRIAAFELSYDVWGDGSFVVVATPGHTPGHVAALVRTNASSTTPAGHEYLLLAGDCCHSGLLLHPGPGQEHLRIGRWRNPGEPITEPPQHSMHEDLLQAEFSFERVKAAEKRDEIMVVLAHDKRRWDLWGGHKLTTEGFELAGWRKKGLKV